MEPASEHARQLARERAQRSYHKHRSARAARYAAERESRLHKIHARGIPCRGCGQPRYVDPSRRERALAEGGPLCWACRRKDADRMAAAEAEIRDRRLSAMPPRPARSTPRGSGRSGTGNSRYRRNRLLVLAASDICGLCGHGGSATTDHIISARLWPAGRPGMDDIENLQPSHGTMGATKLVNRCPTCGKLCNQSKSWRLA